MAVVPLHALALDGFEEITGAWARLLTAPNIRLRVNRLEKKKSFFMRLLLIE